MINIIEIMNKIDHIMRIHKNLIIKDKMMILNMVKEIIMKDIMKIGVIMKEIMMMINMMIDNIHRNNETMMIMIDDIPQEGMTMIEMIKIIMIGSIPQEIIIIKIADHRIIIEIDMMMSIKALCNIPTMIKMIMIINKKINNNKIFKKITSEI